MVTNTLRPCLVVCFFLVLFVLALVVLVVFAPGGGRSNQRLCRPSRAARQKHLVLCTNHTCLYACMNARMHAYVMVCIYHLPPQIPAPYSPLGASIRENWRCGVVAMAFVLRCRPGQTRMRGAGRPHSLLAGGVFYSMGPIVEQPPHA